MSDQSHELSRCVQRERPRLPRQLKAGLFRSAVTLVVIAAIAAGHQIFPRRTSAARPRYYVIERQFRAGKHCSAELARVAISQQNILSRKRAALLRNMSVSQQPDDRWHSVGMRGGMHF